MKGLLFNLLASWSNRYLTVLNYSGLCLVSSVKPYWAFNRMLHLLSEEPVTTCNQPESSFPEEGTHVKCSAGTDLNATAVLTPCVLLCCWRLFPCLAHTFLMTGLPHMLNKHKLLLGPVQYGTSGDQRSASVARPPLFAVRQVRAIFVERYLLRL